MNWLYAKKYNSKKEKKNLNLPFQKIWKVRNIASKSRSCVKWFPCFVLISIVHFFLINKLFFFSLLLKHSEHKFYDLKHFFSLKFLGVKWIIPDFSLSDCITKKSTPTATIPTKSSSTPPSTTLKDINVQFFPCKICGAKFPSYYFVHKHKKIWHPEAVANETLSIKSTTSST